ncbi:MAG TPA: diguanylate cyclase [Candidatus Sulfotelmatobacter sp.]|nr:diguanylate cyclase [Candidatus Sulfotelmatobacter sp.]
MGPFDDPEVCRSILESLPTGLCVVDAQKRIRFWSRGAERITGHLRHEAIGHCCVAEPLLHCDQPGCEFCSEECSLAQAMKTSRGAEATGVLHHRNGYEIPVRIRAGPIHNERGSVIGAVETFEELQPAASHEGSRANALPLDCLDHQTGVASRAVVQSHLRATLASLAENNLSVGILLPQVQGLPHFRAALGPEAASSLMRVLARTLEKALWTSALVGQWSDEQFLVVVNECDQQQINALRERLRHLLAGEGIEWWGERRFLPVSIAGVTAHSGDTVASLLQRAHAALETALAPSQREAGSLSGS